MRTGLALLAAVVLLPGSATAQNPILVESTEPIRIELAGNPLADYPHFEFVKAILRGRDVHVALDPSRIPWMIGRSGDLYLVEAQTEAEWDLDPVLVDVRGAPNSWTIVAGTVQANTLLVDSGTLDGKKGTSIGVGYDVVLDADLDGLLSPGDLIDGLGDEAGFYVVRNTVVPGPFTVNEAFYNGGTWRLQDIYYPSNISSLGQLPLIVVSHGNGHNYQWYDHIGFHMASYGYVVMSHSNNTGPGIETASETTLDNTDHLLGNLDTIIGGVLDGHVDGSRIVWIGHSRGGEGVVRAYDRLFDAEFVPSNFSIDDLVLVSSIAPTTFLPRPQVLPHEVNYHLWVGSADADVTGAPGPHEPFGILERAKSAKMATVLQGAGHGVFHDGGGSWVADGPCQVSRLRAHRIIKGYLLPLVAHFVHGDIPSTDFLWRQWEHFQPIGAPANPDGCIVVSLEYHQDPADVFVIDDFEKKPALTKSSSDGRVEFTVTDIEEGQLDDANTSLTWDPNDPFNGMTRAPKGLDDPEGIVFSWNGPAWIEWEVIPGESDFTDDTYLSFRACQGTRHPNTVAVLEDVTFDVTLRSGFGATSTIGIGVYGGGIEEPYQRTGIGSGAGWSNEFETIRIRLTDFLANGSGLNLSRVEAVRLDFGAAGRSPEGRLGFDDLEIVR